MLQYPDRDVDLNYIGLVRETVSVIRAESTAVLPSFINTISPIQSTGRDTKHISRLIL